MPKTRKKSTPWKSADQRRQYRHAVSVLKKKGLVAKSVDARKAVPTSQLSRKINDFAAVLEGRAKVVTLSTNESRKLKKAGYSGVGRRVQVPTHSDLSVSVYKGHLRVREKVARNKYIDTIKLPIPITDLEDWLNSSREELAGLGLNDGWSFGFRFFGNDSLQTFEDIEDLFNYLEEYAAIVAAVDYNSTETMMSIYRNLEIVTVKDGHWDDDRKAKLAVKKFERANRTGRSGTTAWHPPKSRKDMHPLAAANLREREARKKRAKRAKVKAVGGKLLADMRAKEAAARKIARLRKKLPTE